MAWLYVPGLVASNSELNWPSVMPTGLSVGWNGKPLLSPSWLRVSKTGIFPRFLSGIALPPSTATRGAESWILSLRASRASRSASLENAGEQTIHGTYGPTSPESSESASRRSSSLKTYRDYSQRPLLMDGAHTSWLRTTYGEWVTELRVVCSRRRKSAPHTEGNGCSSWPTATRNPATYSNGQRGPNLIEAAAMWPTPRSEDSESAGNHPNATDSPSGGGPRNRQESIGQGHQTTIAEQAEHWRSPTGRDWKGESAQSWRDRKPGEGDSIPTLANQVARDYPPSHPDPETLPPGGESSETTPTSRRQLNPRFVEWLQGWRPGWTSLAPLDCDSQETGLCQCKQRGHGVHYGQNLPEMSNAAAVPTDTIQDLPPVREGVPPASGIRGETIRSQQVLQPGVRRSIAPTSAADLPRMRSYDAQAETGTGDVLSPLRESQSGDQSGNDTIPNSRAPLSDGAAPGPATIADRARSPHQREQARQSDRKSTADEPAGPRATTQSADTSAHEDVPDMWDGIHSSTDEKEAPEDMLSEVCGDQPVEGSQGSFLTPRSAPPSHSAPSGDNLWITPVGDDTGTRSKRYAQGGMALSMQADNWPTPDTQNARDGTMRAEASGKHAMSLHHVVAGWTP